MARMNSENNSALEGLLYSKTMQKAAGLVLRKTKAGIVMAAWPRKSTCAPTPLQEKTRAHFTDAVIYANRVIGDPELAAQYKSRLKPGETVYACAFNEYLSKR